MEIIQNYIKEDLYEILGVKNDTSLSEIKIRYKKLSIKFHPDKYITRTELSSEEKNNNSDCEILRSSINFWSTSEHFFFSS